MMQLQAEDFGSWDNPALDRATWMDIGDNCGELDVAIHRAAARGDVAELSRLLDTPHDINARCSSENSALHWAIVADKTEAVRFLLSRGADPSLRGRGGSDGREGDDAALCAARFERVSVMEVLIASGVGIYSETLGFAVISKNMDMIRLLVGTMRYDFTDMPRLQALEGILPAAVRTWSLESVQYLMEELKYDASTISTNNQGVLNLALLAIFNQEDVHDQLVETESDKDWGVAIQIIQLLVAAGASVNAVDDWVARTPLHFALQLQYPPSELIDYLLVHNADVNVPNHMGRTPFFQLLTRSDATEEMVRRFQRLGGSLDVMDDEKNTPLHLVKRPEIASLLLVSGADPASKNKYGQTPLHQASCVGDIGVIAQLLDYGADIEAKDSSGQTPLLAAMSYARCSGFWEKDTRTINFLLERGANVAAFNRDGQSATQLIDLKGYHINNLGKLALKVGHHVRQTQDNREEENVVDLW
ncbi:ankyrin repeat-containing domain protein [Paraphoma chrysanthemicola]|uniref:Ankyrin repeat-containing domain protein n=1 Tax=Paraphoma chrysanthemicola TaxID=798071 RepID=A0A8K0RGV7_9PLEO|nr:ankyrin repeat-containing domain protein [Paraphoma chrysanthemicola]